MLNLILRLAYNDFKSNRGLKLPRVVLASKFSEP